MIDQISEYPYIFEDGNDKILYIDNNLLERYSRNLNFLSNFDKKGNKKYDYIDKIINSCVLVLGLGGVGSPLIYDLAALGVGKIIAVDFDFVDISNLNRQILYKEKHVGKKKVYSAKETINEFNSNIEFIAIDKKIDSSLDVLDILEQFKPDCVICVADKPPIKIYKWVNEACFMKSIPFLYGGNSETTAYYHTVIPNISSCFLCYEKKLEENKNKDGYNKYLSILNNSYSTENNCTAASSTLAAFMALDIVRLITGAEVPLSLNKRILIDYKTNIIDEEYVEKQDNCDLCSNNNYDRR
ncbi:MAG: ThiF family adenylyltransferase [Parvimonas sp.]|uniref:HesA/MoeB/ThiF family protein n=1 Tax=Parvimonas sp. TaxID=1944660 RepID=UPI002A76685B|nr:ThiF family adenylyltransferase [Parvimonas sp.]MDY3050294.1 ThiF family adenylyltransferase [Parvimonas sp.]